MSYEQKSITFQFSCPKNRDFISRAIQWRTNSEICHVDVITPNDLLLGARFDGGVLMRPQNYQDWGLRIQVTIDVRPEQWIKFWRFMFAQIGKQYDVMAIVAFSTHHNWRDDKKWFCSEYTAAGVDEAHILYISGSCQFVDPEMFRRLLMADASLNPREVRLP